MFFVLPNFEGAVLSPKKLYISDIAHLMACNVAKFCGVTSLNPKVIGTDMLNFMPIFDPIVKNVKGNPIPGKGCVSKT